MKNLQMLSTADLEAVSAGDMSKVSDQGLRIISGEVEAPKAAKPEPTTAERIAANPLTRFAVGAASPIIGLAQLAAKNPIGLGGLMLDSKRIDDSISTYDQMAKAGGAEGFDLAGLAGAILSPAALATRLPLAATTAGRIGQGAAIGAAAGATTPVIGDDFWSKKTQQAGAGALIGGVIPPIFSALGAGANVVRNVADPWLPGGMDRAQSRVLNQAAGSKRDDILNMLRQNDPIVPGARAGAGEVAAPAGRAEFSALQRVVEPLQPSAYRDMGKASEAARTAAVRTVGGDKAALEAAQATRAANAAQNYGDAYQQAIKADPKLAMISKNPFFQEAVPDAMRLAEANGVNPKTDLTHFLHYVKLSLDKQLSRTGEKALERTERESVQRVQKQLVNWMGQKNPAYESARAQFAADSKPINQMEVGQFLEQKLTSPINDLAEGAGRQRADLYAGALRDAPGTIKRATGQPRYDDLGQVLSPGQVQTVTDVGKSLARRAEYEDLAQKGSAAARELIGEVAPKAPAAGMFNPKYSVARAILNRLQGKISEKALEQLSVRMQDPAQIARMLEMMPAKDRMAVLQEFLQQSGRVGAVMGAVPAAQ